MNQIKMDTDLLFSRLENLITLNKEEKNFLTDILRERRVKRKQFLLAEGAVQRSSFFVSRGLLVSYYTGMEGKEHIVQFAPEGWWMSDLNSFTRQLPARLAIRALEDSTVIELPFTETAGMFRTIPQMDRYFRQITELAFISFQERIIENNSLEAVQRLLNFRDKFDRIYHRLPQKLIASYLGITPEFLSRIRKQMQSPAKESSRQ